jgi:hypothetical protein
VSALEGGLVISRVSGNRTPFLRAIESPWALGKSRPVELG